VAVPAASVGVLPPVLVAGAILAWSSRHGDKDMSYWPGPTATLLCLLLPALMWLQAATRVEAIFGVGPTAIAVLARWSFARQASFAAGYVVLGWLMLQMALIGPASPLQPFALIATISSLLLTWLLPPTTPVDVRV